MFKIVRMPLYIKHYHLGIKGSFNIEFKSIFCYIEVYVLITPTVFRELKNRKKHAFYLNIVRKIQTIGLSH